MARIFKTPFGAQGDTEQVPEAPQGDGSVSLTQGFGYDYEREYEDPAAKDIRREVMNGLFHDITGAIGDIQLSGIAKWDAAAAPYPAGAVVWHDSVAWMSTAGNNSSEPGTGSWKAVDLSSSIRLSNPIDLAADAETVQEVLEALGSAATSSVVQSTGDSATNVMSQKAVTDALGQPSMTGSATLNGTTDNTVVLTDIVTELSLEVGDVIRIDTGAYNKLHTVESITDNNSIIVNYEHAGNRGDGSLKLPDFTGQATVTRIAKWFSAPIGLGQAWVKMSITKGVAYTNSLQRNIAAILKDTDNNININLTLTSGGFSEIVQASSNADYQTRPFSFIIDMGADVTIGGSGVIGYYYEKR